MDYSTDTKKYTFEECIMTWRKGPVLVLNLV